MASFHRDMDSIRLRLGRPGAGKGSVVKYYNLARLYTNIWITVPWGSKDH